MCMLAIVRLSTIDPLALQLISPGSRTTLAQLGLPESFAPARLRVSTRMFPAEKKGEWEPLKVREKKVTKVSPPEVKGDGDPSETQMNGANGTAPDVLTKAEEAEEETLYEEDPTTEDGAIFPLQSGKVVNWSCFFALLEHVYNTLSPPLHTPIFVVAQPAWTSQDHETITQFFFEKFKTPAFCLMDSALAICYAYGVATATVVDVGYEKCDVTAVSDFLVNDLGRGIALPGCGGDTMTNRLHDLLGPQGFTKDMCEQLKKSGICEILPVGIDLPAETDSGSQGVNAAAMTSSGAAGSGTEQRGSISAQSGLSRGPGVEASIGDDDQERVTKDGEENDGVLDVAGIVASGKTSEYLAKKEKEKAEKASAKRAAAEAAAASKPTRLPNSRREKAILHYDERRSLDDLNLNSKSSAEIESAQEGGESKRQKTPEAPADGADASTLSRREERRRSRGNTAFVRRDIEVGTERFKAASGGVLDQIADATHRCVMSVLEINKRSELWDSLIIIGNGSRVKGELVQE